MIFYPSKRPIVHSKIPSYNPPRENPRIGEVSEEKRHNVMISMDLENSLHEEGENINGGTSFANNPKRKMSQPCEDSPKRAGSSALFELPDKSHHPSKQQNSKIETGNKNTLPYCLNESYYETKSVDSPKTNGNNRGSKGGTPIILTSINGFGDYYAKISNNNEHGDFTGDIPPLFDKLPFKKAAESQKTSLPVIKQLNMEKTHKVQQPKPKDTLKMWSGDDLDLNGLPAAQDISVPFLLPSIEESDRKSPKPPLAIPKINEQESNPKPTLWEVQPEKNRSKSSAPDEPAVGRRAKQKQMSFNIDKQVSDPQENPNLSSAEPLNDLKNQKPDVQAKDSLFSNYLARKIDVSNFSKAKETKGFDDCDDDDSDDHDEGLRNGKSYSSDPPSDEFNADKLFEKDSQQENDEFDGPTNSKLLGSKFGNFTSENMIRTHYDKQAAKSILVKSKFKPIEGEFLIKPKEMISLGKSSFIPLDEMEEEEHKKLASVKNWETELQKAEVIKPSIGKVVSFRFDPKQLEEEKLKETKRRRTGSPKASEGKTTKNMSESDVVRSKSNDLKVSHFGLTQSLNNSTKKQKDEKASNENILAEITQSDLQHNENKIVKSTVMSIESLGDSNKNLEKAKLMPLSLDSLQP